MSPRNLIVLILILLLAALVVFIALPSPKPAWVSNLIASHQPDDSALELKLGLDLRGGTRIILEAVPQSGQAATTDDMETARTIIERRVNGLGVAEPEVQVSGDRIIVALPGIEDPDAAIATLSGTGQLEFVDMGDFPAEVGSQVVTSLNASDVATDTVVYRTVVTGDKLESADVGRDPTTQQIFINFAFKAEGAKLFGDYTGSNIGKYLGIVLDKTVLSAPIVRAAISDSGIIEGDFTLEEARNLAVQMRYGALPVPLDIAAVNTIGPTLGADSVRSSITAGIIGVIIVLLFMITYYRLPGLLAAVALVIYAALNITIYKLVPVVLTLPGIAGFLLSTGMAVDANILIFERMKEELRGGRSLENAVEAGFARAWTSILDSNLSTLITCVILYYFGSSFGASIVQGFAITLGIGVLVSMFTAVIVTRTFMRTVVGLFGSRLERRLALFAA
jgi:protein-export membrane protein SecD